MEVIVTIVSKLVSSLFRVTYTLLIGVIHLVSTMDVPVGRQATKTNQKNLVKLMRETSNKIGEKNKQ